MANEEALIGRDDIERFKIYIEISKYAITIAIALAAIVGVIAKQKAMPNGLTVGLLAFGIFVNIVFFLICHRLVSDAAAAITKPMPAGGVADRLATINGTIYSRFVAGFVFMLVYWSITILAAALS